MVVHESAGINRIAMVIRRGLSFRQNAVAYVRRGNGFLPFGGDVSTGTVRVLIEKLQARRLAEIDHRGFYIYNFPGAMEVTALFRPHCRIRKGIVREFAFPENAFYAAENEDLLLFTGKEPNMRWVEYGDCVFRLCRHFGVRSILFMGFTGSVSGLVPHTRDPQFFCSVSDAQMKPRFESYGIKFSDYEGPASVVTYLTTRAKDEGIEMVSLVATVPAYVQGPNPKCVAAVTRRVAGVLGVRLDFDDLQAADDDGQEPAHRVYDDGPLASLDLLVGVVIARPLFPRSSPTGCR